MLVCDHGGLSPSWKVVHWTLPGAFRTGPPRCAVHSIIIKIHLKQFTDIILPKPDTFSISDYINLISKSVSVHSKKTSEVLLQLTRPHRVTWVPQQNSCNVPINMPNNSAIRNQRIANNHNRQNRCTPVQNNPYLTQFVIETAYNGATCQSYCSWCSSTQSNIYTHTHE